MEAYKFAFLAAALLAAFVIVNLAYSYATYKCSKSNRTPPKEKKSLTWNAICVVIVGLCTAISLFYMDTVEAGFCIVFALFAVFGTTVDSYIRIIGNEMLLCLLPIGIAYQIFCGKETEALSKLLDSLGGLGIIIFTFGLAMLGTKKLKGVIGVGMGDVKLSMVIGLTVGWSGALAFLGGMAVSIVVYCFVGLRSRLLQKNSFFPMCGMIMAGFLVAIYLFVLPELIKLIF